MILNGWQRIGVILSILWIATVIVWAVVEYNIADPLRFLTSGESHTFVRWTSSEIIDPYATFWASSPTPSREKLRTLPEAPAGLAVSAARNTASSLSAGMMNWLRNAW